MANQLDVTKQFKSLTQEFLSLRDRVRFMIGSQHWLTDGEWKEAVLRSILRRHLPENIEPVRGFVLYPAGGSPPAVRATNQVDVLLYDNSKPALFRDGDLVFVTPDAAPGLIEVKSKAPTPAKLEEHLNKLAANIEHVRKHGNPNAFAGYFAFDSDIQNPHTLNSLLNEVARGCSARAIDFVCLGTRVFALFWRKGEVWPGATPNTWEAFQFEDEVAPAYFVNNVIYVSAPASVTQNREVWFPPYKKGSVAKDRDLREMAPIQKRS